MKKYLNTVKNIPSGVLSCQMGEDELQIIEISKEHVLVRMSKDLLNQDLFFFAFLWEEDGYRKYGPFKANEVETEYTKYMLVKCYEIENDEFKKMFDSVILQYQKYISLKMNSWDNSFSKELVGYPADEDESFYENYIQWKNCEKHLARVDKLEKELLVLNKEIAISLETPKLVQGLLEGSLKGKLITKAKRIYIGNAFCHNLFPDKELLIKALHYAHDRKYEITLVTTYLRENLIINEEEKFAQIAKWCSEKNLQIEIEINDFGYFELLKEYKCFKLLYGRLLNKRRKDPRYKYKSGWDSCKLQRMENSVNDEDYEKFLTKLGVERFEFESCGYEIKLMEGKSDLHLPFYQTNTSQYCPLYALKVNGDRGKQEFVKDCPGFCDTNVIMYPKHLNMIGKYNSLFALDMDSKLPYNVDRFVWNYW